MAMSRRSPAERCIGAVPPSGRSKAGRSCHAELARLLIAGSMLGVGSGGPDAYWWTAPEYSRRLAPCCSYVRARSSIDVPSMARSGASPGRCDGGGPRGGPPGPRPPSRSLSSRRSWARDCSEERARLSAALARSMASVVMSRRVCASDGSDGCLSLDALARKESSSATPNASDHRRSKVSNRQTCERACVRPPRSLCASSNTEASSLPSPHKSRAAPSGHLSVCARPLRALRNTLF